MSWGRVGGACEGNDDAGMSVTVEEWHVLMYTQKYVTRVWYECIYKWFIMVMWMRVSMDASHRGLMLYACRVARIK